MDVTSEQKGAADVAWIKGTKHHFYEDRFRLLSNEIPVVQRSNRGEIFAIFDGIGGAPQGMRSAQQMSDHLISFLQEPDRFPPDAAGMKSLLMEANNIVNAWGFIPGTDRPLGGCAGTVAWIYEEQLHLFHAGDTVGILIRDGQGTVLTKLHELGGVLYRYFGLGKTLKIDTYSCPLRNFDKILLITDGVTKAFHPLEVVPIIEHYEGNLRRAVSTVVQRSRSKGSHDDITALVYEICWE